MTGEVRSIGKTVYFVHPMVPGRVRTSTSRGRRSALTSSGAIATPLLLLLLCAIVVLSTSTGHAAAVAAMATAANIDHPGGLDVLVGLDVGTQGTKAVLYHPATSAVLDRSSVSYGLDPNPHGVPGRAEQDPAVWVDAVRDCLRRLGERNDLTGGGGRGGGSSGSYRVRGIGVSGQQHGLVPLDDALRPVRPAKLWCDVEASAETDRFQREASAALGDGRDWSFVLPGFSAPKALWLRETEPENWERMRWCVLPHDYVNLVLRGAPTMAEGDSREKGLAASTPLRPTTDLGDASGTGVLDPATGEFVPALAEIVDGGTGQYLRSLPTIVPPNGVAGHLSPILARELLGIEDAGEVPIPISAGSGDNMCAALGCGCVRPGMAVMSLGTSGTIFGVSENPVATDTPVAPFRDATGRHLPLVCTMSCTAALQSVLDNWCNGGDGAGRESMNHSEATELASAQPPGCFGLTFLPFLGGERTPNWPQASGALLGLTPSNMDCMSGGRPGLVYRAAMESITYLLADALDEIRSACGDGFRPTGMLVVGGGSKNLLWRQMLADVLGLDLRFPLEAESAALGAAFQAGAAAYGIGVEEFVSNQKIEMESAIVTPTTDEAVLQSYRGGRARYRNWSQKLFSDAT